MGKPSNHGGRDSSDQPPRPRVSADATIALSEDQLREMEASAGVKTTAPPIPARVTRPKPAAVPHDASVWAGKIMLADEIAPTARSTRRGRRWALAGVLAAAAIAMGIYVARPWWDQAPVVSAAKVVEPVARVAPPPAPTPAPAPVAAEKPATPPPAMTKTTSSIEQTTTKTTSKTVKKTTRKRTASRSTTIKHTTKRHTTRIRKTTRRRRRTTRD